MPEVLIIGGPNDGKRVSVEVSARSVRLPVKRPTEWVIALDAGPEIATMEIVDYRIERISIEDEQIFFAYPYGSSVSGAIKELFKRYPPEAVIGNKSDVISDLLDAARAIDAIDLAQAAAYLSRALSGVRALQQFPELYAARTPIGPARGKPASEQKKDAGRFDLSAPRAISTPRSVGRAIDFDYQNGDENAR